MQKINFFEEIKCFVCNFYWFEVHVITNQSSRLEKHQTLDFLLTTDFFMILFKNLKFCIFQYFRKSLAAHTKIIVFDLIPYVPSSICQL